MKGYEDNVTNLKSMLITLCLYKVNETYDSLRLAKFSIQYLMVVF